MASGGVESTTTLPLAQPPRAGKPVRPEPAGTGSIKVLERAGRILDVLKEHDSVTVVDLVTLLGDNRTTLVRICGVLVQLGLLEPADNSGRIGYRLGLEALRLGGLVKQRSQLRSIALPVLEKMAEQTGDTAYLVAPGKETAICLARAEGSFVVSSVLLDEGGVLPYDRGGGSEAILAFMPPAEQQALARAPEGEQKALAAKLATIRKQGFALSREEFLAGTAALGAPVFRADGALVGAVSVGAIVSRFNEERIELIKTVVLHGAYDLSRLLGFQSPYPPQEVDRVVR